MSAHGAPLAGLFVGIDDYAGRLRLGGCVADAEGLAGSFAPLLRAGRVLANAQATQRRLLAAVERLVSEASAQDIALFYFAGHATIRYGRYFLCPQDTDPDRVFATACPFDLVFDILTAGAVRSLVILDACHGGGAGFDLSGLHGRRQASVLVAAAPNELSREMDIDGNTQGAFTSALRTALDERRGQSVTPVGLFEAAYADTKRRTDNLQHPILIGTLAYDAVLTRA